MACRLSAPSHYLNQCWVIVNWTLRNKFQWNSNHNTKLFIHRNASENIICEMAAILPRGKWVATNMQQAITRTNVDKGMWCHMVSQGGTHKLYSTVWNAKENVQGICIMPWLIYNLTPEYSFNFWPLIYNSYGIKLILSGIFGYMFMLVIAFSNR